MHASGSADQTHKKASHNIIRGNLIEQAGRDGILINGGDHNRIEKNWVTNSSDDFDRRDGIRILALDSVTAIGNVVTDNVAVDNQTEPTQRFGLNISSPQCKKTVVTGNNFEGTRSVPSRTSGPQVVSARSLRTLIHNSGGRPIGLRTLR